MIVSNNCRELTDGIDIVDADGNKLGKSKSVAKSAITQVSEIKNILFIFKGYMKCPLRYINLKLHFERIYETQFH